MAQLARSYRLCVGLFQPTSSLVLPHSSAFALRKDFSLLREKSLLNTQAVGWGKAKQVELSQHLESVVMGGGGGERAEKAFSWEPMKAFGCFDCYIT